MDNNGKRKDMFDLKEGDKAIEGAIKNVKAIGGDILRSGSDILRNLNFSESSSQEKQKRQMSWEKQKQQMKKTIHILESCQYTIDAFLRLEDDRNGLQSQLKLCFEARERLRWKRGQNECADIILSAYYQKDKMKDMIDRMSAYIERIDKMSNIEAIRLMGYQNYGYFLRLIWKETKEQYDKKCADILEGNGRELQEPVLNNITGCIEFIEKECQEVEIIRDIPEARKTVTAISRKIKGCLREKKPWKMTEETRERIAAAQKLAGLLQESSEEMYFDREMEKLDELRAGFESRLQAMERDINKGERLYQILNDILTEEWFDTLDAEMEGSPVASMTAQEVKELYIGHMKELVEKLSMLEGREG